MSNVYGRPCSSSELRKMLVLWMLSLLIVVAVSENSHSALTVLEDSGSDSTGHEEAQVNDEFDDEDLEVFQPSNQWQTLKPGQAVPRGSHVRLNLQTGQREAKLGEEQQARYLKDGQRVVNTKAPSFTARELKEALKMFKEGVDDPAHPQRREEEEALKAKFRPLDELKRDMAELDMRVETDVDIMRRLITKFNSSNATVEERVKALLDLEYLVHQVDNAQNLVSMGGMKLVINALNSSDFGLQGNAAFVLGSAVSSNPSVQVEVTEGGALLKLLTLLATPRPIPVKKKALFAVASLLRHFPYAQGHFLKLGGMQVLVDLFQTPGGESLRIRIVTLIYDMIVEKELMSQSGMDQIPDSTFQERLRQYAQVTLLPVLAEQGWCRLVPELLASSEHDWREKALRTLLAMMPYCQEEFRQNRALISSLGDLQKQYRELVLTEQDLGEEDGYFGEILILLDTVALKVR
ncbi:nucleotide exchange factor SIL1 [Clupea harengus]|uniref:Nucleotide exchange factor SIL1 n=1 Tax=Clupea harengus TaxID=7950 RepID=A0A6P3W8H1_CLUHA|nr:nucleotide exchange factor SIL1 [Clupea harengus]XP_042558677.1 nucleotide exchange factor SIL1 [Clupea harengus]